MVLMNTGCFTEDGWTAAAHFGEHSPSSFLARVSPGPAPAAQTEHPSARGGTPAPHPPWRSLSACMAIGAGRGLNRSLAPMGLTLNWFAQEQAAGEEQLPEEAGCAPAAGSQDARLQDSIVPGEAVTKSRSLFPAFLHDFRVATFIRKQKPSALSNPRARQLEPEERQLLYGDTASKIIRLKTQYTFNALGKISVPQMPCVRCLDQRCIQGRGKFLMHKNSH